MLSPRFRAGVRAGLVAASATAGAIAGYGLRNGDWALPFLSLGRQLLAAFGVSFAPRAAALVAGAAGHAAWMVLWGICFAVVAWQRAFWPAALAGLIIALGAGLLAQMLVPAALGAVGFSALPLTQFLLCIVLMTAGFVAGRAASGVGPATIE